MQQVEDVVDHPVLAAVLQIVLQGREIRHAVFVDRDDFAVENDVVAGSAAQASAIGWKLFGPVEPGARLQR